MLPKVLWGALIGLICFAQGLLLVTLVIDDGDWQVQPLMWLTMHALLAAGAGVCTSKLVSSVLGKPSYSQSLLLLVFFLSLCIPVVGVLGGALALYEGYRVALLRHRIPPHWRLTPVAKLPFTTPSGRKATRVDSRGFTEHLMYSKDSEDLYRKVLAVTNMKNELSVTALKYAMSHRDERLRLIAYKSLDKKVSQLNRQIQLLEQGVAEGDSQENSNTWLQIASNYWELLTLEKDEPVARQQLLNKAAHAAIQAVLELPSNRNAHFLLGRASLAQKHWQRAEVAFNRSRELGMPSDKVMPYLAEVAFNQRRFDGVRGRLAELNPATRAYPPLVHVARYWG